MRYSVVLTFLRTVWCLLAFPRFTYALALLSIGKRDRARGVITRFAARERPLIVSGLVYQVATMHEADPAMHRKQMAFGYDYLKAQSGLKPDSPHLRHWLGSAQLAIGDFVEARRSLTKALELSDNRPDCALLYQLGMLELDAGAPRKALPYLKDGLDVLEHAGAEEFSKLASYLAIGYCYWKMKDRERCVRWYTKALDVSRSIEGYVPPEVLTEVLGR